MNFKVGRFLYTVVSFLLGIFFLTVGFLSIFLPWFEFLKIELVQFILKDTLVLPLFGLGFLLIGCSLLAYMIRHRKQQYVHIRTGPHPITIDENLIRQYLDSYWHEQFPKHSIPSEIKIKKNMLQIEATFPFLPKPEQAEFLAQIKQDFEHIFGNILGYPHEIQLIAGFQSL